MAVAPLSLRTEDPGLSGVLGMAKVAASGTHLAEARSQSAQGFRVFSFSARILIFSFLSFTFWSAFLFHWISLWMNCIPCQVYSACLVSWTSFLRDAFFGDAFWAAEIHPDLQEYLSRDDFFRWDSSWLVGNVLEGWFPLEKCILICWKSLWGMISGGEMHPDLLKMSWRDDFRRGNVS